MAQELKAETIVPQGSAVSLQMYPKADVDAVLAEKEAEIRRLSSNAYAWSASNLRGWKIAVYYDKKAELYRKWQKRWLGLAEKFKEAK